jgi:hypothetical protein
MVLVAVDQCCNTGNQGRSPATAGRRLARRGSRNGPRCWWTASAKDATNASSGRVQLVSFHSVSHQCFLGCPCPSVDGCVPKLSLHVLARVMSRLDMSESILSMFVSVCEIYLMIKGLERPTQTSSWPAKSLH